MIKNSIVENKIEHVHTLLIDEKDLPDLIPDVIPDEKKPQDESSSEDEFRN